MTEDMEELFKQIENNMRKLLAYDFVQYAELYRRIDSLVADSENNKLSDKQVQILVDLESVIQYFIKSIINLSNTELTNIFGNRDIVEAYLDLSHAVNKLTLTLKFKSNKLLIMRDMAALSKKAKQFENAIEYIRYIDSVKNINDGNLITVKEPKQ